MRIAHLLQRQFYLAMSAQAAIAKTISDWLVS